MSWMILKGGPGLSFPYSNVALSHVPHQFAPVSSVLATYLHVSCVWAHQGDVPRTQFHSQTQHK